MSSQHQINRPSIAPCQSLAKCPQEGVLYSRRPLPISLATAFLFTQLFGVLGEPASATDEVEIVGSIIGAKTAPVMLSRCHAKQGDGYWHVLSFNGLNRTRHQLLSFDVMLKFYDVDNALLGQTTVTDSQATPLAPDDITPYVTQGLPVSLSEPVSAVTRFTCQATAATFTGNKHWTSTAFWPEKLRPLPQVQLGDTSDATSAHAHRSAALSKSPLDVFVSRAWNDTLNGATIVHAAVVITGGSADSQIHPSDFFLTMALANGFKKHYPALAQGAPTYQKINPLGNMPTTAFEVDPHVDLGRLGNVIVPAHGNVNVIASFLVLDPVADANDNKNVTLNTGSH
jgi:hypothetical protein